jgi:hypothetical protein
MRSLAKFVLVFRPMQMLCLSFPRLWVSELF